MEIWEAYVEEIKDFSYHGWVAKSSFFVTPLDGEHARNKIEWPVYLNLVDKNINQMYLRVFKP